MKTNRVRLKCEMITRKGVMIIMMILLFSS
jgi:hypothetical protein